MQIHVRINEAAALRQQRHAFTDRFTLVSELLQNARRAGASRIDLRYHEADRTLCITDNGGGIEDFQALLSLHESAWNPAVCEQEQAFGVGFSQCLYRADGCSLASRDQRIAFACADALAQHPIEVETTVEVVNGTRVELSGVDLPDWQNRIEELCLGFPVPVTLNGECLPRPLALSELDTRTTDIGDVYVLGQHNGWSSTDVMVFLQGVCIWRSPYSVVSQINVVHLDPRQFLARLPDRDKLIDEDLQLARIHDTLRHCWRDILVERMEHLSEQAFLDRYYYSVRRWQQVALLNRLSLLPREVCCTFSGYPVQGGHGVADCTRMYLQPLSRDDLEARDFRLVALPEQDASNAAHWMFARARGDILCNCHELDDQHWAQAYVVHLETQLITVSAVHEQQRVWFEGRSVRAPVVLCESVTLAQGWDTITLDHEGLFHNGNLYIPRGEISGAVVRQACSYVDDYERFHQDDAEVDEQALAQLIRRLRCSDPEQTLHTLLGDVRLSSYPVLHGQRFVVGVSLSGEQHSVRHQAAEDGDHAQC